MIPCQDPAIGFCSNLIPPSGGTYTLTQFLGVFLARAEELAGPRDPGFTILGIEFFGWEKDKAQPETWFPGGRNHIAIRLTRDVANNPQRAIFQLSHEVAHLITPLKKPEVANNLEEGFASVLADEMTTKYANTSFPSTPAYAKARGDVAALFKLNPQALRYIRELQKFNKRLRDITPAEIKKVVPAAPSDLAERLCQSWKP